MKRAKEKQDRTGYEEKVGRFRAKAKASDPGLDNSPMVQELIARLQFASSKTSLTDKKILDYGCGTGEGLRWAQMNSDPERLVGLDISSGAIEFARLKNPEIEFRIMDIENAPSDLKKEFDIAFYFEVIEHLNDQEKALSHLINHYLKPEGQLVLSTPNRKVFSGGMDKSPMNRTHVNELTLDEFSSCLKRNFSEVSIWGMRFKCPEQMKAYERMVRISCDGYRLFGRLWWNPLVNRLYRWLWRGEFIKVLRNRRYFKWKASDFEFIEDIEEIDKNAIWFFSIAKNHTVRDK